jgi:hypothetical protein
MIDAVDVQLQPSLKLGARLGALVTVRAHDPDGDALRYFWSGVGIPGTVEGPATMTLAVAGPPLHGGPVLNVVVQDPAGAAARAKVVFTPQAECALCGGFHVIVFEAEADENDACFGTHDQCLAACDAQADAGGAPSDSVHAACQGQCGKAMAACVSG